MNKIWMIADTHWFHFNIIEYCNRPFANVDEMNAEICRRWNERVGMFDTVYHLGDVALCGRKKRLKPSQYRERLEKLYALLFMLNGKIKLCKGSHDKNALDVEEIFPGTFDSIADTYLIEHQGQKIFMSHCLHKVWPESHYGTWHLFGHSHGAMNSYAEKEGKLLDVGVDSHDFYPWSFDEIAKVMKTRPDNFNDVKYTR